VRQTTNDDIALTAAEIAVRCRDITALMGGGEVKLVIGGIEVTDLVTLMCFPNGIHSPDFHFLHGTSHRDAFTKAREWAMTNHLLWRSGE
jgi:hypothetical protein